jgi:trehalose/maltose transport system substrate-binding protein
MPRFLLLAATACLAFACHRQAADQGVALHFVTFKPDQPAVWDEAIRRFEAAHPGTRVVREVGPNSSTALHDMLTQKLKNRERGVDVFFMDVIWSAEFAAAGWAAPLDSWFGPAERSEFLPGTITSATWEGKVHGVPAFIDAGLLYYRKDLLAKHGLPVPTTWPDLEQAARRIVDAERSDAPGLVGFSGQFKQYEGLVCDMLELVESNGGRLVDPRANRSALSERPSLEAVGWVRDRIIGAIAPRSVLTYQEPESLALFLQGEAVFHRNWPYAWQVVNDPNESKVAGKVGVSALPHFPAGRSAAALGGWHYGVSAFSPHPEEARELIRFMTSPETQKYFAVEASLAPTRAALYEDPEVRRRNPQFADQAAAFRQAVPRPVTPVYPAVSEVLQRYFSQAIAVPESDLSGLAAVADAEINRYLEWAE